MSLSATIQRLANATIEVERQAGSYVEGRYQLGAPERFLLLACVQPLDGEQLFRLPDGQRTREHLAMFTTEALRNTDTAAGTKADRVTVHSRVYEVQRVEPWDSFFWAMVVKVE